MHAVPIEYAARRQSSRLSKFLNRHKRKLTVAAVTLASVVGGHELGRNVILPPADYSASPITFMHSDPTRQHPTYLSDTFTKAPLHGIAAKIEENYLDRNVAPSNIAGLAVGGTAGAVGLIGAAYATRRRKR